MTPVTITKTSLKAAQSGADVKRQLNAIGLFPHSVEYNQHINPKTYIAHWVEIESRSGQAAVKIEDAVSYAIQLMEKLDNVLIIATHTGYAFWRESKLPMWSHCEFMIKMEETK
jgi:hypothetical protein